MTHDNVLAWNDVEACADLLAEHLPAACGEPEFDRIIGVARGGLVPAVLVAAKLRVKRVESVQVRYYDGDRRLDAPVMLGSAPTPYGPSGNPAKTLIVDELVDSGETMRHLSTIFPDAQLATLIARQRGEAPAARSGLLPWINDPEGAADRPVWVARAVPTEQWILFPWSSAADVAAGSGTP
ncbi:MAG: phosphoribosyltransferase family protein [Planctomycetota bacterium]|nr:phosphoribosyltransferase family protein [Planctomycetota bacterium]